MAAAQVYPLDPELFGAAAATAHQPRRPLLDKPLEVFQQQRYAAHEPPHPGAVGDRQQRAVETNPAKTFELANDHVPTRLQQFHAHVPPFELLPSGSRHTLFPPWAPRNPIATPLRPLPHRHYSLQPFWLRLCRAKLGIGCSSPRPTTSGRPQVFPPSPPPGLEKTGRPA